MAGVLWVGGVVADHVDVQSGRDLGVDPVQEPLELDGAVAGGHLGDDLAGSHIHGGVQVGRAVAEVVVGGLLEGAGQQRQDRGGAVQGLHLGLSSTHSTRAASGGFRDSPTTSRTLSMNCGSVDSLKVSIRCGLSPNAP
jgi:hypothetical protein